MTPATPRPETPTMATRLTCNHCREPFTDLIAYDKHIQTHYKHVARPEPEPPPPPPSTWDPLMREIL